MQILNNSEFKTFKTLARMSQANLHKTLYKILSSMYPQGSVTATSNYLYAIGDIPICLVAHMDTVWDKPPVEVFYDRESNVIWSPQGLGADDRAGVFAIIKILTTGLRPHIVFTTDEERGCIGASILSTIPCPFKDCRFIIELDRANQNDCVFYDCYNTDFESFIEQYGFETHMGTYSDITELCPMWGMAGVNLSIGYRDEHSVSEVLFVRHMLATINKVIRILSDCNDSTPFFKYESLLNAHECTCSKCKKVFPAYALIPVVTTKDGARSYMCGDCITNENVDWCLECGEAVMPNVISEDGLCPDCEAEEYEYLSRYSTEGWEGYRVQPRIRSFGYPADETNE